MKKWHLFCDACIHGVSLLVPGAWIVRQDGAKSIYRLVSANLNYAWGLSALTLLSKLFVLERYIQHMRNNPDKILANRWQLSTFSTVHALAVFVGAMSTQFLENLLFHRQARNGCSFNQDTKSDCVNEEFIIGTMAWLISFGLQAAITNHDYRLEEGGFELKDKDDKRMPLLSNV